MSHAILETTIDPHADLKRARAIAAGDMAALDLLYHELVRPVYAFVFHRVGGLREDAEDVTQDTFLTAVARLATFDGRSTLATFMFGIARLKALERVRSRQAPDRRPFAEDTGLDRALLELESGDLPSAALENEETADVVGAALAELPEHWQTALLAKYVDGASYKAVAESRDVTPKAAESLVLRAKSAFVTAVRRLARARLGDDPERI